MVLTGIATLAIGQATQAVALPKLNFANGAFEAKLGNKSFRAPLPGPPVPARPSTHSVTYRKDASFVVWDARGLSLRFGGKVTTTRMAGAPFHAKLFDARAAAENRLLVEYGGYSPEAAVLRASRRIGQHVWLVAAWQCPGGSDWFEALYRVDMGKAQPAPEPILRLQGRFAHCNPGDGMPVVENRLVLAESNGDSWGLLTIDLRSGAVKRIAVGHRLEAYSIVRPGLASFVERTEDGSRLLGRLRLTDGLRMNLSELDGQLRLLDGASPLIAVQRDQDSLGAHNLESGAKLKLGNGARLVRCGPYVVVWNGGRTPTEATLYDPLRWDRMAVWRKPAPKRA